MGKSSNKRGVAVTGPWQPVSLQFLRSRTCAELSPHAAKLMFDVLSMLGPNANRNGDISITPKTMALRGWSGRETLGAAVRELIEKRLIIETRQGTRMDCRLFAVTLFPLDCDLSKLDVKPGCYSTGDWMAENRSFNPPTEQDPAVWNRARKLNSVTPPRDEVSKNVPPRDKVVGEEAANDGTSSRHGTKPPIFELPIVPPRVTYLDMPSTVSSQSDEQEVMQ